TKSELSKESPHFPLPVQKEQYSLGMAGNVAVNIKALGAQVYFISCISDDWRGSIFKALMAKEKISTDYLVESGDIITPAYIKPVKKGISSIFSEEPTFDFLNYKNFDIKLEDRIIDNLKSLKGKIDLLLVYDRLLHGCMTYRVREVICSMGYDVKVIADNRDKADKYKNVIIKTNETGVSNLTGMNVFDGFLPENLKSAARNISSRTNSPIFITLGKKGAFFYNNASTSLGMQNSYYSEAVPNDTPIDVAGAGDAFMSAIGVAMASGAAGNEALEIGNLASAVVIKAIGEKGTANKDEIIANYKKVSRQ
ncbi:MAG: PfkB family carbohydrate kinase, partial [Oscillospiraceae bacterium]|nr:PfkB family carbohydrate kinase [Oscillospiraceae bacterium]